MSISLPLIAKGFTGAAALVTTTFGVIYRKEISSSLFGPEITDEEINKSWTIENVNANQPISITYPNGTCSINVVNNKSQASKEILDAVKDKLEEKLIKTNLTETEKKYKRAILKSCKRNWHNTITLNATSTSDINYPDLFSRLDEEVLNESEKLLSNQNLTFSDPVVDDSKLTITVTVSTTGDSDLANSSIGTCKIVGHGTEINSSNLTNSKSEIKTSVETKVNENKGNFLTKCKRSFDNEIKLPLVAKAGDTNKYELKNLSSIFAISS